MMLKEFSEGFIPEKVLHREEQIKKLTDIFNNFRNIGMASNLLIQGFSGSGKTLSVKKVLQNQNGDFVFVSGAQSNTAFKLVRSIFDVNASTIERVLSDGIIKFQEHPKVIIIDEINKLKNKTELRILFDILNTFYRETECPIILITNQKGIVQAMPDDARLTLMFEKIEFNPYNATQLSDIFRNRMEDVFKTNPNLKIPDGRLNFIGAVVNKEIDSSARAGLKIIKKCLLNNNFSDDSINSAIKGIVEEGWRDYFGRFTLNQKKLFELLIRIMEYPKKIPYSDILKHYSTSDPSTISKLVDSVEETNIIVSEYENKGRAGGNKKFIFFNTKNHYEKIKEFVEEENIY